MSTFKAYNPYDGSLLGEFKYHSQPEVDDRLDKLEDGLRIQKSLTGHERSEILRRLGELLLSNKNELAQLITKEVGKTISESTVEIERAANTAFCSADEARQIKGEVLDSDNYLPKKSRIGIVRKKPIGVVLAITPFNFPINLAMHKIGPAFAAGNSIMLKPGPQNYASGEYLIKLCHQAGMPENTIQFCFPDIPVLTEVIKGKRIQCISFTGGTKTADSIAANAGRKKLLLELGGNDPMVLMPDGDISMAVETAINQRFGTAGQKCTASKRIFIHADVYDQFKEQLLAKTKELVVGDPSKTETFIGPVVSECAANLIESRINAAITDGATCLIGGKRVGNLIYPTILENVNLNSDLVTNETFGPVIPLIKFEDLDDAIEIINSTPFGLHAGVFTNDIRIIEKLYDELDVGCLAVNDGPGFRAEHFPFGGVKDSGLGREGVRYTIDEMSVLKTLVL